MEHPVFILPLAFGSVAFYAGINQLVHYIVNRQQKEGLYFAAGCILYFLFALFSSLQYLSQDPDSALFWQRARSAAAFPAMAGFLLFSYDFFRIKNRVFLYGVLALPLLALPFFLPGAYIAEEQVKTSIYGLDVLVAPRDPLMNLPWALGFALWTYMSYRVYREWRRAKAEHNLVFLIAYTLVMLCFLNDVWFVADMYITEYGSLLLVGAMSYNMAYRAKRMSHYQEKTSKMVVDTHIEYEKKLRDYADELEHKVNLRTKELVEANREGHKAYEEIDRLNQFTRELTSHTDIDDVLDRILNYITNNFGITTFWLLQIDSANNELFTERVTDFLSLISREDRRELNNFRAPLKPDLGLLWRVYRRKVPVYLRNMPPKTRQTDVDRRMTRLLNLNGLLLVPLIIQNEVKAIACFSNYEEHLDLKRSEIKRIARFCNQIAGGIYSASLIEQVEHEKAQSDRLLKNILPDEVARELKEKGEVQPVYFEQASVIFTDLVGFTRVSEKKAPREIISDLNTIFLHYDRISEQYQLEKIKTIGDAYMAAGGLPVKNNTHPVDICLAALEFVASMKMMREMHEQLGGEFFDLRVGIHTGPLMAGVVGKNKFAYDIFGDTVNVASRMESGGAPGRINISEDTYKIVAPFFDCEYRGELKVKNRGTLHEYFLNRIRPGLSRDSEGMVPNDKFRELYELLKRGQNVLPENRSDLLIHEEHRPITTTTGTGITVLEMRGEINTSGSRELQDHLEALLAVGRANVILDLRGVEFIDSTGVGTLISIHRHFIEQEGHLALINIPAKIKSIFEGLGVSLYEDVETALDEMEHGLRRVVYPEDLDFNMNFHMHGRDVVLKLAGKLNYESARILRERMEALARGDVKVLVLNCEKLKSIDSSGFGVILFGHNRFGEKGGKVRLVRIPDPIMELLHLSSLDNVLDIMSTEEEAFAVDEKNGIA